MALPNFLIIGDLKAGTSSLYRYIRQHPQVYMPETLKELRFFSYDKENPYHHRAKSSRVRDLDSYAAFFEKSQGAKAVGEASPNYFRSPGAFERIRKILPSAKLILSLRNPVDRLYSLYLMRARAKNRMPSFEEVAFSDNATWIKGNAYAPELERLFRNFDQRQVKIVLFDDLVSEPETLLREVYEFLDLDPGFSPAMTITNKGGVPRHRLTYSSLVWLKDKLKSVGRPPLMLKNTWARIRDNSLQRAPLENDIRKRVLQICLDDIIRTEELLGRDLKSWID